MIPVTLSTKDGERKERKNPEDTGKGERNTDHQKLRGLENSVKNLICFAVYRTYHCLAPPLISVVRQYMPAAFYLALGVRGTVW